MQATNEQIEKMTTGYMQAAGEMNTMMRDTVNAALESISIMTKGCSELCNSLSGLMQKQMEQNIKTSQTIMTTTNVNDLVSTQNTMMKTQIESMMCDINNMSQISSRIAQQAAEPVTKIMNTSMSKMSKMKAA